jgi:hypothetical protein
MAIQIEPTEENGGFCDCCGSQSRTVWGSAHEAGEIVAVYFVQWTVGQPLGEHPANIDLIYGPVGEGTTRFDRRAVSLIHFENENGPAVMVTDASARRFSESDLVGTIMQRSEVLGTALARHVFRIVDAILLQDPRLS